MTASPGKWDRVPTTDLNLRESGAEVFLAWGKRTLGWGRGLSRVLRSHLCCEQVCSLFSGSEVRDLLSLWTCVTVGVTTRLL